LRSTATDSKLESVAVGLSPPAFAPMRLLGSPLRLLALGLALALAPVDSEAQIFRGFVRSAKGAGPIAQVTVTARDTTGTVLAVATTDSTGAWAMRVRRADSNIELRARRLGFSMSSVTVQRTARADTLEYEFLLDEIAATAEEVRITGAVSLNEQRLNEAYRRGWKVYEPELVAQHRERAADLAQLLRTLGTASVYPPRGPNDCFRATRNNMCLTLVVDGQVLGPVAVILPSDIYFLAILGASEARVQFGDRAPWGAIAIYSRSRYDRTNRRP
jgi:hypothetical protein